MRDPSSETLTAGDAEARAPRRTCPECGATLVHTNGCVLCGQCGYSPCD